MNLYEQVKGKPQGKERNIKNLWKRDSYDDNKGYITGRGCAVMNCGRVEEAKLEIAGGS